MTAVVLRGDAAREPLPATPQAWLLRLAAEAHRRKWAFTDNPVAFDALHRIGNEILAAWKSGA